jgi:hypothetical protein
MPRSDSICFVFSRCCGCAASALSIAVLTQDWVDAPVISAAVTAWVLDGARGMRQCSRNVSSARARTSAAIGGAIP